MASRLANTCICTGSKNTYPFSRHSSHPRKMHRMPFWSTLLGLLGLLFDPNWPLTRSFRNSIFLINPNKLNFAVYSIFYSKTLDSIVACIHVCHVSVNECALRCAFHMCGLELRVARRKYGTSSSTPNSREGLSLLLHHRCLLLPCALCRPCRPGVLHVGQGRPRSPSAAWARRHTESSLRPLSPCS